MKSIAIILVLMAGALSMRVQREVSCPDSDQAMEESIADCSEDLKDAASDTAQPDLICTVMDDAEQCYEDLVDQCSDSEWLQANKLRYDSIIRLLRQMSAPNCPQR
ncbi:hypothetical protein ACOMHN_007612 [Nucella lapillus]